MQVRRLLKTAAWMLLVAAISTTAQSPQPTMTLVDATATPIPTITPAMAVEIRSPPGEPESFWDKYGIITAVAGAVVAMVFGVIVRPAIDSAAKLLVAKFENWRSDFRVRYLRTLIEEHRVLSIRGVRTTGPARPELEQVYVSLRTRRRGMPRLGDSELDISAAMRHGQRLAIIGEAGSGKTTLLHYLALTFARGQQLVRLGIEARLFPIYVPLRNLKVVLTKEQASPAGLASYLTAYYNGLGMTPPKDFFEGYLRRGQCLLMLDGLDEVADEAERLRVAEWVDQQVAVYPDNRYILTSRVAGYEKAELTNDFSVLQIQPFHNEDVERFCHNWCLSIGFAVEGEDNETVRRKAMQDADDLVASIGKNPAIRKLATNPLMLSIIALVHRYRAKLPERRVELYAECLGVLLGYWDQARGLPTHLTPAQKQAVLQPIAVAMHEAEQHSIDHATLRAYLAAQLPKVGGEAGQAEEFLQDIKERSGVLLESETNEYAFSHLSFQEYLTALELLKTGRETELLRHASESWWHEVIRLYSGLKDATSVVSALLSSRSQSQLLLAGYCIVDAEQVGRSTRDRTVRELEKLFARSAGDVFLRVGHVLAEIAGEDSVDFFLSVATDDSRRAEVAMNALVEIAQQPDERVRQRVQDRLIMIVKNRLSSHAKGPEPRAELRLRALEVLHWIPAERVIHFLKLEMCPEGAQVVPVGEFLMGEGSRAHRLKLPTFFIDRHPVTNAEFGRFVEDDGYTTQHYWTEAGWEEKEKQGWSHPFHWDHGKLNSPDLPVVGVSWYEAMAYCGWCAAKTGLPYRLPTEAEWEKAARGTDGRAFPWGDEWDESKCNTRETNLGVATPVGTYSPEGDSPYGVADMAGNVWEWCSSLHEEFPYVAHDGREVTESSGHRTVRGGSWNFHGDLARCSYRDKEPPTVRVDDVGFRCCVTCVSPEEQLT